MVHYKLTFLTERSWKYNLLWLEVYYFGTSAYVRKLGFCISALSYEKQPNARYVNVSLYFKFKTYLQHQF
jgi:hypothetical protein